MDIQKQIDELKREIENLKMSSTIPRDIQTAFTERLAVIGATTTGSLNSPAVYAAFPVTVPASASGTIGITVKGTTYNVFYK